MMPGGRPWSVLLILAAGLLCTPLLHAQSFEKSYAVLIAVDTYQHPSWPHLAYPESDAKAFAGFLASQGFVIKTFYGPAATKRAILSYMTDTLARQLGNNDRVLLFFAGHGHTETLGGRKRGYIVPYDGESSSTLISMDELQDESSYLGNARHQLFLLDSCFSGLLERTQASVVNPAIPNYMQEITARVARQALTAGGENEQVVDSGPHGHSVFMDALLDALRDGQADLNKDGYITFSELAAYVVPSASNRYQTPAPGYLPGHQLGEFWFINPRGASRAIESASVPANATRRSGEPPATPEPNPATVETRDDGTATTVTRTAPVISGNEWTHGISTGGTSVKSVELQTLYAIKQQTPLERVYGLAFSPDGQLLASAWQEVHESDQPGGTPFNFRGNGSIRLWNVGTGQLVQTLKSPGDNRPGDQYSSVAFSPDGRLLAASTSIIGPAHVDVWDLQRGAMLHTFPAKEGLRRLTFSPDGRSLAAACDDNSVYIWDPNSGKLLTSLKHPDMVVSVTFSPANPDILVAGDYKQSVRVWNFRTSTLVKVLYSSPPSYGEAVAFSPDGRTLATGHASGALILWDTATWKPKRSIRPGGDTSDGISSVAFSPDGKVLEATSGKQIVSFWDAARGTPLGRFDISDGSQSTRYAGGFAVFSPLQRLLATSISGDYIQMRKVTFKYLGD